ncbi:hypothetical protein CcI49_36730 [Frankia sp. CcI49]|nr:hypothetical protein [Frankia sp. CcI49]ONH50794.1 hypothetical protein CcI49_36730 [Frankia sp. CcI49]
MRRWSRQGLCRSVEAERVGTGYYDASGAATGGCRRDLLALALRRTPGETARIRLPEVAAPGEAVGRGDPGAGLGQLLLGPGCGDNAGAALGLGLRLGECLLSLGTSGVVAAVSRVGTRDGGRPGFQRSSRIPTSTRPSTAAWSSHSTRTTCAPAAPIVTVEAAAGPAAEPSGS